MKRLIILLLAAFVASQSDAQQLKSYSGRYDLDKGAFIKNGRGCMGEASYTYYEDASGQRVYQGKFTFRGNGLHNVDGNYKNGKRDGKWRVEIIDAGQGNYYEHKYSKTGDFYHLVEYTYKDGVLNGEYSESVDCLSLQEAARSYYRKDGKPSIVNKMYISRDKILGKVYTVVTDDDKYPVNYEMCMLAGGVSLVSGQTNERGKATGNWTVVKLTKMQYCQICEYFEGVCCKIYTKDESKGTVNVIYELPNDIAAALKSTYNAKDDTFIYQGDTYKLKENRGGKSMENNPELHTYGCVIDVDRPLFGSFTIPQVNVEQPQIMSPFFTFYNFSLKEREEKAAAEAKAKAEAEARAAAEAKAAAEARRKAEIEERKALKSTLLQQHEKIFSRMYVERDSQFLGKSTYSLYPSVSTLYAGAYNRYVKRLNVPGYYDENQRKSDWLPQLGEFQLEDSERNISYYTISELQKKLLELDDDGLKALNKRMKKIKTANFATLLEEFGL